MKDIFEDKRFSLIELLMISLAGALWTITAGGFGFALLMLVLVPWGIRLQQGRPPLRRTPLDLPLGLFFLTLLAATGLSYSGTEAWSKFWVMAGGVFLYFALVQQSRRDIWMVAAGAGPVAALLALYFVLTHNWNQWPAELAVIQWLGQVIMRLRPALPLPEAFHPNTFGGIIAMLLPFSLAFVLHARTHRRSIYFRLSIVSILIAAGGLLLTSSLWSLYALGMGVLFWLILAMLRRAARAGWRPVRSGGIVLLLLLFVTLTVALLSRTGEITTTDNRLGIMMQTWYLIQDFSITGSGLAAFPALYAQYIRVTPNYFIPYSNLYLDLWLELGLLGLAALLAIWGLTLGRLLQAATRYEAIEIDMSESARRGRRSHGWRHGRLLFLPDLQHAALASWLIMVLYGFTDNALFGGSGTPLLFFVSGMAIVVTRSRHREERLPAGLRNLNRRQRIQSGALLLILLTAAFLVWREPLTADWYANRAALQMAEIELQGWPTGRWDPGHQMEAYDPVRADLLRSLDYADTVTAYHRLGLIAMLERDYTAAVDYLEAGSSLNPIHRGLRKSLGYSYLWTGEVEQAYAMIGQYGEVRQEITVYQDWWRFHERPDLAQQAAAMFDWITAAGDLTAVENQ